MARNKQLKEQAEEDYTLLEDLEKDKEILTTEELPLGSDL